MPDTIRFAFRAPLEEPQPTVETLLERAWPEAPDGGIARAFDEGRVRIENRITHNPDKRVGPGLHVEAQIAMEVDEWGMPEADALERGDSWAVVDKPVGMPGVLVPDDPMNPILYLADKLGVDRGGFEPAWPMPSRAGGPWLFGLDEGDADALRRAWFDGELMTTWSVLVPRPNQPNGTLPVTERDVAIRYSASKMQGRLAELQLTPRWEEEPIADDVAIDAFDLVGIILDGLAEAGMPALGDRNRSGYMVGGGLRLRLAALFRADSDLQHSWKPPSDWWPDAPVVPEPTQEEKADELELSRLAVATSAVESLRRTAAHPWVLADRQVESADHLAPGTLVELRGEHGGAGPVGLYEGVGDIAARLWSRDRVGAVDFEAEVDMRVDEAFARRSELLGGATGTDFYRLIHGEADDLPGFLLDRIGPVLQAHVVGRAAYGFKQRVYTNLTDFDPDMMILEIDHTSPADVEGQVSAKIENAGARYLQRGRPVVGHDTDLRWSVDPWNIGWDNLRPARRPHRRNVADLAGAGDTWLNLATPGAGTGIAAAAAGADVHLPTPSPDIREWWARLRDLNDIPEERWHHVEGNDRGFPDTSETFDGIVLDLDDRPHLEASPNPPDQLDRAFAHLADGGVLLVTAHEIPHRDNFDVTVRNVAGERGLELVELEACPPAEDFPAREGFPEGTPFEARLVRVG